MLRTSSGRLTGKSGAMPARSRHCDRVHPPHEATGELRSLGRRGTGETRKPGDPPPTESHESLAEGEANQMKTRFGTRAVLATALACAAAAGGATAVHAAPVKVNVRIEGATKTLFEGPVTTDAHAVTADTSGPHPCDGTNGGAHPTPGPTATGALDDAAKLAGLTW